MFISPSPVTSSAGTSRLYKNPRSSSTRRGSTGSADHGGLSLSGYPAKDKGSLPPINAQQLSTPASRLLQKKRLESIDFGSDTTSHSTSTPDGQRASVRTNTSERQSERQSMGRSSFASAIDDRVSSMERSSFYTANGGDDRLTLTGLEEDDMLDGPLIEDDMCGMGSLPLSGRGLQKRGTPEPGLVGPGRGFRNGSWGGGSPTSHLLDVGEDDVLMMPSSGAGLPGRGTPDSLTPMHVPRRPAGTPTSLRRGRHTPTIDANLSDAEHGLPQMLNSSQGLRGRQTPTADL